MTKEVWIAIRGLQFDGEIDGEKIETITKGEYYLRNNVHYLIFEEVTEGFDETTKTTIKIKEKEVAITKKGLANVSMLFEEKKRNMTSYGTPFGAVMIGIDTNKVEVSESEEKLEVAIAYSLELNYEHITDCEIVITVHGNKSEGFHI